MKEGEELAADELFGGPSETPKEPLWAREKIIRRPEHYRDAYVVFVKEITEVVRALGGGVGAAAVREHLTNVDVRTQPPAYRIIRAKLLSNLAHYEAIEHSVNQFWQRHEADFDLSRVFAETEKLDLTDGPQTVEKIPGGLHIHLNDARVLVDLLGTTAILPDGTRLAQPEDVAELVRTLGQFGYMVHRQALSPDFRQQFWGDVLVTYGAHAKETVRHEQREALAEWFLREALEEKSADQRPETASLREVVADLAARIEDGVDLRGVALEELGLAQAVHVKQSQALAVRTAAEEMVVAAEIERRYQMLRGRPPEKIQPELAQFLRATISSPLDFPALIRSRFEGELYASVAAEIRADREQLVGPTVQFVHARPGRAMHSHGTLLAGDILKSARGFDYRVRSRVSQGAYGVVYQAERINPASGAVEGTVYLKEALAEVSEHALHTPWEGGPGQKVKAYPGKSLLETIQIDFPREHHQDLYAVLDQLTPADVAAQRKAVDAYLAKIIPNPLAPTEQLSRRDYYLKEVVQGKTAATHEAANAQTITARAPGAVVQVLDSMITIGELDQGERLVIVMEQAPGKLLEEVIGELAVLRYPLKERDIADILIAFAEKMKGIHTGGLAHADIKPSNLFVKLARTASGAIADQEGQPLDPLKPGAHLVVEDVGIIDVGNVVTEQMRRAGRGAGVGTPGFAARELYAGGSGGEPASDIYALGVVATCLLRREDAPPVQLLNAADATQARRLINDVNQQLSPQFYAILERMLRPNPRDRYQDARELLHDLDVYRNPYDQYLPFKQGFHFADWLACRTIEEAKTYLLQHHQGPMDRYRRRHPAGEDKYSFPSYLAAERTGHTNWSFVQSDQTLSQRIEKIRLALTNQQELEPRNMNTTDSMTSKIITRSGEKIDQRYTLPTYELFSSGAIDDDQLTVAAEMSFVVHTYDVAKKLIDEQLVPVNIQKSPAPILSTMLSIIDNEY